MDELLGFRWPLLQAWRDPVTKVIGVGCIYCATNRINGKRYIGQTIGTMSARKKEHEWDAKRGGRLVFHRALHKYGFDAFDWEELYSNVSEDRLNTLERRSIVMFDSRSPYGYNLMGGGSSGRHAEETRDKIRKTVEKLWQERGPKVRNAIFIKVSKALTGCKQSEKTKTKRRRSYEEKYGPERAIEIRAKQSAVSLGVSMSETAVMNMALAAKNRSPEAQANAFEGMRRFIEQRAKEGISPVLRQKLRDSHLGKKPSKETIEKMKTSQQARRIQERTN